MWVRAAETRDRCARWRDHRWHLKGYHVIDGDRVELHSVPGFVVRARTRERGCFEEQECGRCGRLRLEPMPRTREDMARRRLRQEPSARRGVGPRRMTSLDLFAGTCMPVRFYRMWSEAFCDGEDKR